MIKVLHISPSGRLYGTERHIFAIVKHSDKGIFQHTVAAPSEGNFTEELNRIGIRHVIAGRPHGYGSKLDGVFGSGARSLLREIRRGRYDIVHTHLNSFGGILGKLGGVKAVIHTRHGVFWSSEQLEGISFSDRNFQKLKSHAFDLTIAIGEYERKTLTEKFGYDASKIRKTINGVDAEEIRKKVNNGLTKEELFGTKSLIAGSVGRLEKQKGFEYLIDAAAVVNPKELGLKFVIIGNGNERSTLLDSVKKKGLEDSFRFIDYKENVLDYVNLFDFYVSTSRWEGLSYSVQEAMALGKPVIALSQKNVSGLGEIIVHGETGFLIEDEFENQLPSMISKLATDTALRRSLGEAAMEREKKYFPESRTAKDMDGYYLEALGLKNRTMAV